MDEAPLLALQQQLQRLQQRVELLEACAGIRAAFEQLQRRVSDLERSGGRGQGPAGSPSPAAPAPAAAAAASAGADASYAAATRVDASPTQQRLARELYDLGFSSFRFVRAPPDYYGRDLEYRRGVLDAASTHHLCKSIIMENTRAHPDVKGCEDPNNSKFYLVIVQYTARFHAEKLKNHIHKLNAGRVGKQYFNMRLCDEAVSDQLSGFEHNAVSPIGIRTRMPWVISHAILQLQPDFFWLGAGEVDLKVGLSAAEFVKRYQPMVVDCTY